MALTRPSPERIAKLDELADLHAEWIAANAASAGFKPKGRRKRGGDYPLHHVDLDAKPKALDDFHRRAAAIFTAEPEPDGGSVAAAAGEEEQDSDEVAWLAAVATLLGAWPATAAPLVDDLVAKVAAAGSVATLASLAAAPEVVDRLAAAIAAAMVALAGSAADQVVADAAEQGVMIAPVEPDSSRLTEVAAVTAALIAAGYASAATRRALAAPAGQTADLVRDTLAEIGTAGRGLVGDRIRAAMSAAQHEGRRAVFVTNRPVSLVADESHDRTNRCQPCADVNGKTYPTVEAAMADYPAGGYHACLGGSRCRGRLTARWA